MVFGGMLALALLDAGVSSTQAANRVGGLLHGLAVVVEHILSPTVPAIPDLRTHGGALGNGESGGAIPYSSTGTGGAAGSLLPPEWTTSPTPPVINV